jgi:hypothetical protein
MPSFSISLQHRVGAWLVLALSVVLLGCARMPEPVLQPTGPHLRVVSYNINWGGGGAEAVVAYLRSVDADLVFLQETHPRWEQLLRARLGDVYPSPRPIRGSAASSS